jgi:hypothetical protein
MSLAEIMPAARLLPREEKLELVRVLSADLDLPAKQESEEELIRRYITPGATYQIFTPQVGAEAVQILQQLLHEHSQGTEKQSRP